MADMGMVERVARAIDPSTWENWDNWIKLKGYDDAERAEEFGRSPSLQKSLARAADAIEAMREPTDAMEYAGVEAESYRSFGLLKVKHIWANMIAAALGKG